MQAIKKSKILNLIFNLTAKIIFLTVIFLGIQFFGNTISGDINVRAEEQTTSSDSGGGGISGLGFSECDFENGEQGASIFTQCIGQIVQFIFVLSLFLIAFRIAFDNLGNMNPIASNSGIDNTAKIVTEITIGLLLIGGPALFLTTLNPALTSINIFDISGVTDGSGGNNGGGNKGSGTDKTSASSNNSSGGATSEEKPSVVGGKTTIETPEKVKDAIEKLKSNPQDKEATEVVSSIIKTLNLCKKGIVDNNTELANCLRINSGDYQDSLKEIEKFQANKQTQLAQGLIDNTKVSYTDPIVVTRLEIIRVSQISLPDANGNRFITLGIKDGNRTRNMNINLGNKPAEAIAKYPFLEYTPPQGNKPEIPPKVKNGQNFVQPGTIINGNISIT